MSDAPRSAATTSAAGETGDAGDAVSALKVPELRAELQALGAGHKVWQGMEKADLVRLVIEERKAAAAAALNNKAPATAAGAGGGLRALLAAQFPDYARREASLRYGRVATVGNTKNPTAVVSFCHGLGDTCDGWAAGVEDELATALPHVLFVLPTAATQPVSMNMGMAMPAWYDIKGLGPRHAEDPEGVALSAMYLDATIAEACAKHRVPRSRVVFAGFSQGAALSLATGMLSAEAPAGIAALSGYLAARDFVIPNIRHGDTVPVLMMHGTADPMVPLKLAEQSKAMLEEEGKVKRISIKTYRGMQHSSCPQEMADFVQFLNQVIPA